MFKNGRYPPLISEDLTFSATDKLFSFQNYSTFFTVWLSLKAVFCNGCTTKVANSKYIKSKNYKRLDSKRKFYNFTGWWYIAHQKVLFLFLFRVPLQQMQMVMNFQYHINIILALKLDQILNQLTAPTTANNWLTTV